VKDLDVEIDAYHISFNSSCLIKKRENKKAQKAILVFVCSSRHFADNKLNPTASLLISSF
jgi:hypothetical protein